MPHDPVDGDTRRDIQAYWAVHRGLADELRAAALAGLRADPTLAPVIDAIDEEASARQEELVDDAVTSGDWQPFVTSLREQGAEFARREVAFSHWFRVVNAVRTRVVPHLVSAYGDDPDQLAAGIRGKGALFDLMLQTIGDAYLRARQETIATQRAAIAELSTPVLQIRPGLLLMPLVGVIDSARSRQLTDALLTTVHDSRARVVVMDITGVPAVDSEVASRLIQAAEAARLMGAVPILTGISSGVAQTLVTLGVDLKGLRTVGDLQTGLGQADQLLGLAVVPADSR